MSVTVLVYFFYVCIYLIIIERNLKQSSTLNNEINDVLIYAENVASSLKVLFQINQSCDSLVKFFQWLQNNIQWRLYQNN